jgi:hypothetical protein
MVCNIQGVVKVWDPWHMARYLYIRCSQLQLGIPQALPLAAKLAEGRWKYQSHDVMVIFSWPSVGPQNNYQF